VSGKLSGEVVRFLASPAGQELTPPERLVLMLIAERANEATRQAWQGGQDAWSLAPLVGVSDRRLQEILARLAKRGLEVRVERGKDALGRPVYATWNVQTTYLLPHVGRGIPHPVGDSQGAESRTLVGRGNPQRRARNLVPQGAESRATGRGNPSSRVRDSAPLSLRVPQDPSGVPEDPSGAQPRDDNAGASSRPAPAADNTAVRELREQLAGQRAAKLSRWDTRPAEPNPLFDPGAQARLLEEAYAALDEPETLAAQPDKP
jgi:hypothetical protein